MSFTRDFGLQSEGVKGSPSDSRGQTSVRATGDSLTSFRQGEDGISGQGNKVVLTYTYQNVGRFSATEQVAINRESHHKIGTTN